MSINSDNSLLWTSSRRATTPEGYSPLHRASGTGSPSDISSLTSSGSEVNQSRNELGLNPLHTAVYHGRVENLEPLLEAGADLEARDKDGNTPFQWACCSKNLKMAEALLNKGAKIDTVNDHNESPLDIADRLGHDKVIKFLCERNGHNYMIKALENSDYVRVCALLTAGVSPTSQYHDSAKTEQIKKLFQHHLSAEN